MFIRFASSFRSSFLSLSKGLFLCLFLLLPLHNEVFSHPYQSVLEALRYHIDRGSPARILRREIRAHLKTFQYEGVPAARMRAVRAMYKNRKQKRDAFGRIASSDEEIQSLIQFVIEGESSEVRRLRYKYFQGAFGEVTRRPVATKELQERLRRLGISVEFKKPSKKVVSSVPVSKETLKRFRAMDELTEQVVGFLDGRSARALALVDSEWFDWSQAKAPGAFRSSRLFLKRRGKGAKKVAQRGGPGAGKIEQWTVDLLSDPAALAERLYTENRTELKELERWLRKIKSSKKVMLQRTQLDQRLDATLEYLDAKHKRLDAMVVDDVHVRGFLVRPYDREMVPRMFSLEEVIATQKQSASQLMRAVGQLEKFGVITKDAPEVKVQEYYWRNVSADPVTFMSVGHKAKKLHLYYSATSELKKSILNNDPPLKTSHLVQSVVFNYRLEKRGGGEMMLSFKR